MNSSATVIITAHEQAETLCLVLLALARQTVKPDEVVVADDGSGGGVAAAVAALAGELPFRLLHIWQPHEEFRAARSRNTAIHHSRGRLVAFLDQDALPLAGWLERHAAAGGQGRVAIGQMIRLPVDGPPVTREEVRSGRLEARFSEPLRAAAAALHRRYARYAWLRGAGLPIKSKPKLISCDFSASREDLLAVNGFDEEYVGWGQEDDDLGRRLYAAGVQPVVVVRDAPVLHIPHPVRHAADWGAGANAARFARRDLPVRCVRGLSDHPHPDVRVTELR